MRGEAELSAPPSGVDGVRLRAALLTDDHLVNPGKVELRQRIEQRLARQKPDGSRRLSQHGMRSVPTVTDHKCKTREAFSIRYTPSPTGPRREQDVAFPVRRSGTRRWPAFALVIGLVEPPAGIEPATPSLPWNHQEPLCGTPFPQLTPDRRGQSYRSPSAKLCAHLAPRADRHCNELSSPVASFQ